MQTIRESILHLLDKEIDELIDPRPTFPRFHVMLKFILLGCFLVGQELIEMDGEQHACLQPFMMFDMRERTIDCTAR